VEDNGGVEDNPGVEDAPGDNDGRGDDIPRDLSSNCKSGKKTTKTI